MMEAWVAALFGLLIGSFLNVCIYRMPRDLSVVRPRSFCPGCERTIAWYDNIPVVSFLMLRGRCRHCGFRIPKRYPAVEVLTAAFFFVVVSRWGLSGEALRLCLFSALLIGLVFSDLEERILPDEFTLGGLAAGLLLAWFVPLSGIVTILLPRDLGWSAASVAESAAGAALGSGLLWLVGEVYFRIRGREGMGLGDVKMMAMVGAFLGLQGTLATLVVGSLAGSILGLLYVWLAGKDHQTYELPYGTFLGAAALGVGIWGEEWVNWWIGIAG